MRQRTQRRPGAAYSLPGGGRCRGGPNDILPPKQEGAPSPSPARSNPAKAPTGSELQQHRAQSTMYPASSCPRYHLRTSTADYIARCSSLTTLLAPHRTHFSALATRYTPLLYPQDPSFSPPSPGILCPLFARNDAFGDTQHLCSTRPCAILSFAPLRPRHAGRVQCEHCEARRLPGHRLLSTRSSTPRKSYTFFHA